MPEIAKSNWRDIHRFEIAHGEIKDSEQPAIPLNFGPGTSIVKLKGSIWSLFFIQC
jgi:hypothetical protein